MPKSSQETSQAIKRAEIRPICPQEASRDPQEALKKPEEAPTRLLQSNKFYA